jgi:hypothetical protein
LNGPISYNNGAVVFTGTGIPGDTIFILVNGIYTGISGVVGSNGTYTASGTLGSPIGSGDSVSAAAGSPGGPSGSGVTASAPPAGVTPTPMTTLDAGATFITVGGTAGQPVTIVDPVSGIVLGSGVIPAGGELGITLSPALTPGQQIEIIMGGVPQGGVITVAPAGQPPVVTGGTILVEGSVLQGTGVPGATVQAVDANGVVLGSAVVDPQGNFSLSVSGATQGVSVSIVQDGVASPTRLMPYRFGNENSILSANVFRPEQGGVLVINFKAPADDHVTVHIFNVAGDLVRPLLELDVAAGVLYAANWDGRNGDGTVVASGIYVVSVHGKSIRTLKKVVVIK